MFNPPTVIEAWISMMGCYWEVVDLPPPPDLITIAKMSAERAALYPPPPPLGCSIPIVTLTFHVDDYVPEEEDIVWAIRRLFQNRTGGLSEMQAEHLRSWLAAATRE